MNQLDAKERQSGKHIMRHLSLASEAYNITLSVDGINAALYKEKAWNNFSSSDSMSKRLFNVDKLRIIDIKILVKPKLF